jgi:hypothetical protein
MNDVVRVLAAAAEVEAFCRGQEWRFCFIGAVAVQRWGVPRFTQDVDLTLFTGWGSEAPFVDALLKRYSARVRDARNLALARHVLLARTAGGVDLDIALGALPFEEECMTRATLWRVNNRIALTTCSAEDLVVHKVYAGRDRDWSDVEGILARQHGKLDLAHLRRELPPLLELKDETDSLTKLERMIATVDARLRE